MRRVTAAFRGNLRRKRAAGSLLELQHKKLALFNHRRRRSDRNDFITYSVLAGELSVLDNIVNVHDGASRLLRDEKNFEWRTRAAK